MNGDLDPARRLYASPGAFELIAALPELALRLKASLDALERDPTYGRCADLALMLYGAQTHLQRLRTAIERGR